MVKTILLIDPDPRSIPRIRRVLGREGLRVQLALDGRSGVDEFRRLRPDVTLIQDRLPVMDGLEACRRMKQLPGVAVRPVVILTSPRSHDVLFETGCDAYIEKPFEEDELIEVVRTLLSRGEGISEGTPCDLPARSPEIDPSEGPVELT